MSNEEAIEVLRHPAKAKCFVLDKAISLAIIALENCPPEESICYGCQEDCKECETNAMAMI